MVEYGVDIRKEDKVGGGGTGNIFYGTVLKPDLASKWDTSRVILKILDGFFLTPFAFPYNPESFS